MNLFDTNKMYVVSLLFLLQTDDMVQFGVKFCETAPYTFSMGVDDIRVLLAVTQRLLIIDRKVPGKGAFYLKAWQQGKRLADLKAVLEDLRPKLGLPRKVIRQMDFILDEVLSLKLAYELWSFAIALGKEPEDFRI